MLRISQRPLQATAVDAALFVNRAVELEQLARSVRHGFNSLVLGQRGIGKTSLLRQFERQLTEKGLECRFVEASAATTAPELIEVIHTAVHGRRRDPTERLLASIGGADDIVDDLRHLAPSAGEQIVVLLDGIGNPDAVQHLFGRLRDEVWQLPFTWVVSGNRSDRSRYLEPPADAFFDTIIEVGELDKSEATDLLRRRARQAGDDPDAEILLGIATTLAHQVTPCTPRNLLAAAREVLIETEDDPKRSVTRLHALQARASQLGRAPVMLLTEVIDLGPVSASDKTLLDHLGWTRPRAAQVFKQLEEAGLVTVITEAPNGPGRPRKLYAANSMHQAVKDMEHRDEQ